MVLLIALFGLSSCGPKMITNLINKQSALTLYDKVAFLDKHHKLPTDVIKIGHLTFQDTGFTTDCSFNSLMNKARQEARKNAANIVKLVEEKKPDFWSGCYRLKVALYRYEGNVKELPQIQITLD